MSIRAKQSFAIRGCVAVIVTALLVYAGAAILMIGMPLWLESYAAALLALIPIGILALRILVEEKFLRRELQGYDAYTKKVRYRLIPLVW